MFRKCAAPSIGEIKRRHVQDEHGVVPACAWSKDVAQPALEIVFTWFGFHCNEFVTSLILMGLRPVTTWQWRDFVVPLSGEERKVARGALDG
jgi:hypothetical protein